MSLALATLHGPGVAAQDLVSLPETVLPDGKRPLNQTFSGMPGDLLMSGRIVRTEAAIADGSATVSVDRFSDSIAPGNDLTSVLVPPAIATKIGTDRVFCGRDQRTRSAFTSMMIGGLGSKFKEIVRFCFLDVDRDAKFDHYMLAGAKDKLLQVPRDLEPLAYHMDRLTQLHPDDEVRLRYRKFVPSKNKVELEVEVVREGKKTSFDYILWSKPAVDPLQKLYSRMYTEPAKIPYPVMFDDVIGAEIKVLDVKPTGEATFRLTRDFTPTLMRPETVQVRYIYIYY
ncbi:hypothetical protein AB5I39_10360 [Sphingomonas sp. MMS24-J45]|uniref:hypothetical protein n=1 Tax=Sphingomonas sp. MMS24-J45 TaxID=3238806 RepID=UPI00384F483E